jgi:hypothetical protein
MLPRCSLIDVLSLLHAITVATHAAKGHRRTKRNDRIAGKEAHYDGRDGFVDGSPTQYPGGRVNQV